MNIAPYSLLEAQDICKEYKNLVGESFTTGSNATIQCIAVTPYDEENKARFIGFYFLLNDAEQALLHAYKGLLFDVMIIACSDEQKLLHESFHTWLLKKEVAAENIHQEQKANTSSVLA